MVTKTIAYYGAELIVAAKCFFCRASCCDCAQEGPSE
jgi:hypothetical protein